MRIHSKIYPDTIEYKFKASNGYIEKYLRRWRWASRVATPTLKLLSE